MEKQSMKFFSEYADFVIHTFKPNDLKKEYFISNKKKCMGIRLTYIPLNIVVESDKYSTVKENKQDCLFKLIHVFPGIKKTCNNCAFYDVPCCMFNYACSAILDEEVSAEECINYFQGIFDENKLAETDYKLKNY